MEASLEPEKTGLWSPSPYKAVLPREDRQPPRTSTSPLGAPLQSLCLREPGWAGGSAFRTRSLVMLRPRGPLLWIKSSLVPFSDHTQAEESPWAWAQQRQLSQQSDHGMGFPRTVYVCGWVRRYHREYLRYEFLNRSSWLRDPFREEVQLSVSWTQSSLHRWLCPASKNMATVPNSQQAPIRALFIFFNTQLFTHQKKKKKKISVQCCSSWGCCELNASTIQL